MKTKSFLFGSHQPNSETGKATLLHSKVRMAKDDHFNQLVNEVKTSSDLGHCEALLNFVVNSKSYENLETAYNLVLGKFPLLYGYWIQFANETIKRRGDAEAIKIYERAVTQFPVSVDLWVQYLTIAERAAAPTDVSANDAGEERSSKKARKELSVDTAALYERGARACGFDFYAHPFWDMYLGFIANAVDKSDYKTAVLLKRICSIPLHQYSKYAEQYLAVAPSYYDQLGTTADDVSALLEATRGLVESAWQFESKITRSYFHTLELEPGQIQNWLAYLSWATAQNLPTELTSFLFERALVPTALYDSVWIEYMKWSNQHGASATELQNLFRRATSFLPVKSTSPYLWVAYMTLLESRGLGQTLCRDISSAYLADHFNSTVFYHRVQLERRFGGPKGALKFLEQFAKGDALTGIYCKTMQGALQGRYLFDLDNAETVLQWNSSRNQHSEKTKSSKNKRSRESELPEQEDSSVHYNSDMLTTWFELKMEKTSIDENYDELHQYWSDMVRQAAVSPRVVHDLSDIYKDFLDRNGQLDKWMEVDLEINGSISTRMRELSKRAPDGNPYSTLYKLRLEAGHPGVEIDPLQHMTLAQIFESAKYKTLTAP